jgi:murein DD-endopeptidase MepM/ murein hydrolase activator NlpD
MARSTDPLAGPSIGVVASLPTARLAAPRTNAALELAQSLAQAMPEARAAMQGYAEDQAQKQAAKAKKDALVASGAKFADAVRRGVLKPTQNPWYMQAYERESSALSAQQALRQLQADSTTWDTQNDPSKFQEQWQKAVGEIAQQYEGPDQIAGFSAAERAVTSQVLQQNTQQNVQRIETERMNNLTALSSDALRQALRESGGTLSPNEAWNVLLPTRQQWFATGGDINGWQKILYGAIETTARGAEDSSFMKITEAGELLYGPSEMGNNARFGSGASGGAAYPSVKPSETSPDTHHTVTIPSSTGLSLSNPLPIAGASSNHRGVDLAAPAGTPVQAQATGKVIFAGKDGGLGNAVRIDYGNGVISTFGHLSSINVKEGQLVMPGEAVGGVGRTGVATGNHLHWSMSVNGKDVDPLSFKGKVGGSLDVPAQNGPSAETFVGFPGQDQPFQASGYQQPGNVVARGPSLYDMPGVSQATEQAKFYIQQAAEAAPMQRARVLRAERQARGLEGSDLLWQNYGTAILTGGVSRQQMIHDLGQAGYSGPEIAMALNNVNEALRDSVGVASAQIAANSQNPGQAAQIMNLKVKGIRDGYTPQYETEVGNAVLAGQITGDEGAGMISSALSASDRDRAEARTARNQTEADANAQEGRILRRYRTLTTAAEDLSALVRRTLLRQKAMSGTEFADGKRQAVITNAIATEMRAWLAEHPEDFDGAYAAGQAAANRLLTQRLAQVSSAGTGTQQKPASGGGNPRR